jgi:hypothetical protein
MIGNPKRNSPLGLAQIHPQTWLDVTDHGERARPVLVDENPCDLRHINSERTNQGRLADQYRRRHVTTAMLRLEQPPNRLGAERISADSVDRVGGQHDAFASLDRLACSLGRFCVERRISSRAIEPPVPRGKLRFSRLRGLRFTGRGGRGHRSILPFLLRRSLRSLRAADGCNEAGAASEIEMITHGGKATVVHNDLLDRLALYVGVFNAQ